MSTKLYVANLPYETTESDLQTLFEGAGQVSTINIVRDRATGQWRGLAFVEMSDVEGTRRAISELDRRQFGGRNLTVDEAKPLAPRGNGGGLVAVSGANRAGEAPALLDRSEPGSPIRARRLRRDLYPRDIRD